MAEETQNPQPAQSQPAQPAQQQSSGGASKLWYLIAILLGFIGGILAYVILKDKDPKMAKNALILGIVVTVVIVVLQMVAFSALWALMAV